MLQFIFRDTDENHKNKTKTAQSNNYLLTCVVDRFIIGSW